MSETEQLLPCPFCGGEAVYSDKGWGENQHKVYCSTNTYGCEIGPEIKDYKPSVSVFGHSFVMTKEQIISAWNTRNGQSPVFQKEMGVVNNRYAVLKQATP